MALQKQPISIPFALGLDQKTDKWQLAIGNFLSLVNSVFTTGKQLTKRNGFPQLTALPTNSQASTITTFNDNLLAIGNSVYAYSNPANTWSNQGYFQSLSLSVQPLIRTAYSQTVVDAAVAVNGLVCTAFLDGDGSYKYQISDSTTGQSIIPITLLPATATLARVYTLNNYFVITFLDTVSASTHLQYIAIPIYNPTLPTAATDIGTTVNSLTAGYDGASSNNSLYFAWANGAGGISAASLSSSFVVSATVVVGTGHTATLMSVAVDNSQSTAIVWISAYASSNTYTWAINQNLLPVVGPVHSITGEALAAITSSATSTGNVSTLNLFYEVINTYSYDSIRTDYINTNTVTQAGTVGTETTLLRSVGLASKAFRMNGVNYMMVVYGQSFVTSYQPTFFLMNGSNGDLIGKLAYSNAGGYMTTEILPKVQVTGTEAQVAYLYADQIQAVNTTQGAANPSGVYAQTGINLATWNFSNSKSLSTAEIGHNLHISGGFPWMYDGVKPVEHGFNVWPEPILAVPSTTGGSMSAQVYFYVWVYEWTDAQGNIHRSAPSIPFEVTTTSATSSVLVDIPTLRLTYKTAPNVVRLVGYRWSTAQEIYYQITSVTAPLLNNTTVDSVTYLDTQSDAQIIGNNILYTTGGVVENIAAPATSIMTLFDTRLWLVDAEDPNLLWFSKQVIEATPVEFSDLFTFYVSPTQAAQGSTGPITALAPMDDKLVVFKADAIYYINGIGPDNTGTNNQYSPPTFIAGTVGSVDQDSIVLMPSGLMFQSDKGVWLLGRDLSTQYIGAPVEGFNGDSVTSALCIPGTNQVRFTVSGTISSTLFKSMHTILDENGVICQETAGNYTDNTNSTMLMYDYYFNQWGTFNLVNAPVTISFTTAWINLAGVQGYERAYHFFFLANYLSPHKLQFGIAYDYNPSIYQAPLVSPSNYAGLYGNTTYTPIYGNGDPYGGIGPVEQWRLFLDKQKCQSFQVSMQEVFDPSFSTEPGAGLTMSGLNLIVGIKKGYRPIASSGSVS